MLKKILSITTILSISIFFSNCTSSLYYQARDDASIGNYEQAISKYRQVIQTEPANSDAYRELGISYYKINDMQNAMSVLEKSLQLKSDDGFTIFYLGLVNESLSDFDRALNYYRQYINLGMFSGDIKDIIEGRIQYIAKRKIENELKTALKNEAEFQPDTSSTNTIAVLNFKNIGSNKELDPLQKGLTDMMITKS